MDKLDFIYNRISISSYKEDLIYKKDILESLEGETL